MLKGIAASSGVAIGKVYKLEAPKIVISEAAAGTEEERLAAEKAAAEAEKKAAAEAAEKGDAETEAAGEKAAP